VDSNHLIVPIIFVLLAWWFSTGAILYLDGLSPQTFPVSMAGATAIAIGALMLLAQASHEATTGQAYAGFACALVLWGWQEMAFLMGFITGSRRAPCPLGSSETNRFLYATEAIIHHELALIATLAVLFIASWNQPNQTGAYTFLILWIMRLSAKLNLFFGVRNRYESFLPKKLAYLETYFGRRMINLLFPVVVTASSVAAFLLWQSALAPEQTPFHRASYSLLATLLSLAVLEHWFLVIPLKVEKMWQWAMKNRTAT
jgi:putative photosynthetic complex assembly protein 2